MLKLIDSITNLLVIPVMILNFAGLLIGGIWLLVIGQWKIALGSLLFTLFGNYALMGPLAVGLIFVFVGTWAQRNGWDLLLKFIGAISGIYTATLMFIWACGSLAIYLKMSSQFDTRLPFLLCSYAVATGPWQNMAANEENGPGGFNPSATIAGFLSMSYVLALGATLIGLPIIVSFSIIGVTLLIALTMNLKMASDIHKAQRKFGFF